MTCALRYGVVDWRMQAPSRLTLDTSFFARVQSWRDPQSRTRLLHDLHGPRFAVHVNKESLLESAQLAIAQLPGDRRLLQGRAHLVLAVLDLPLLRSIGDIIESELQGVQNTLCANKEVENIRQVFERLAKGERPSEVISFCQVLKARKDAHGKYWALVKREFEDATSQYDVVPEDWYAFRQQVWTTEGLAAVGTRVPPNGVFAFSDAAERVLTEPGRFPFTEAYVNVVLNYVWRVIDQRRTPLEPNVHDLDMVMYLAQMDVLVSSEQVLAEVISDVFGGAKRLEDPTLLAERLAGAW